MSVPAEALLYAQEHAIDTQHIYPVDNNELLDPRMLDFRKESGVYYHKLSGEQYLVITRNSTKNNGIIYTLMDQIKLDILMRILQGQETREERLRFRDIPITVSSCQIR